MGTIIPRDHITPKQAQELLDYLTVKERKKGRYGEGKVVRCFTVSEGKVLLPLMFAQSYFGKQVIGQRSYPICNFSFKGDLRNNQPSIAEEALSYLSHCHTVTLVLPPATGKTVLAAYLASKIGGLTLVLFDRTFFYRQWSKTFNSFTNALLWMVGEPGPIPPKVDVILCLIDRVKDIPTSLLSQVRILVVDEFHCFYTEIRVNTILQVQPEYSIALTATPTKNGLEGILYAFCGSHEVIRFNERPFRVLKILTGIKVPAASDDWDGLCSFLAGNSQRDSYIVELILRLKKRKHILLAPRVSHTKSLLSLLQEKGESVDYLAGDKATYRDSRVLAGTISKIGTGFDEATACLDYQGVATDTVTMVGTTLSDEALQQYVGRSFRAPEGVTPMIIQFIDVHPISTKHWRANAKWYTNNKGCIEILTIEQALARTEADW